MKNLLGLAALACILSFSSTARAQDDYRAFLIRYEGINSNPYKDAESTPLHPIKCVGIGHRLAPDDPVDDRYTDGTIEYFYQHDLKDALRVMHSQIRDFDKIPLLGRQVLIELEFNVGPTGFYKFKKFRQAINNRDYDKAADELENSKWARQVGTAKSQGFGVFLEVLRGMSLWSGRNPINSPLAQLAGKAP